MPDRFGLQKAVDESRGERFIILIEGTGQRHGVLETVDGIRRMQGPT